MAEAPEEVMPKNRTSFPISRKFTIETVAEGAAGAKDEIGPFSHRVFIVFYPVFDLHSVAYAPNIVGIEVQYPERKLLRQGVEQGRLIADQCDLRAAVGLINI